MQVNSIKGVFLVDPQLNKKWNGKKQIKKSKQAEKNNKKKKNPHFKPKDSVSILIKTKTWLKSSKVTTCS